MMKRVLFAIVFFIPCIGLAQVSNTDLRTMLMVRDLERESRPSRSADLGPQVEGDPYYSKYFNSGSLTIYRDEKTFTVEKMRYDIHAFALDIRIDNALKSIDGSLVHSFEYTDSLLKLPKRFLNGKDFTREGTPISGFLEVLCWGKVDVYQLISTTIVRPNFTPGVQGGNPNYEITRKRVLLYGPGTELRKLERKELELLWRERAAEMSKFQKINKLNPSRERDLMLMIDYFNTL